MKQCIENIFYSSGMFQFGLTFISQIQTCLIIVCNIRQMSPMRKIISEQRFKMPRHFAFDHPVAFSWIIFLSRPHLVINHQFFKIQPHYDFCDTFSPTIKLIVIFPHLFKYCIITYMCVFIMTMIPLKARFPFFCEYAVAWFTV